MRRVSRPALVCGIIAGWPWIAEAQQARPSETPKWEITIHAGGLFGSNPTGGTPVAEFPIGNPLPVVNPVFTSRSVSSWHFGDGSLLLNQANLAYALGAPSLVPLDAALEQRLAERRSGVTVGGRVSRSLTSRLAAEFSVDYAQTPLRLTRAAEDAIEATRASFGPAWLGLLATGATANRSAASTADIETGSGYEMLLAGTLNIGLGQVGRLRPYVVAGGGGAFSSGTLPRVALTGRYGFNLGSGTGPSFEETDHMTARVVAGTKTFIAVMGGGFKYPLSSRQGLRVDARLQIGSDRVDTVVDATPTVSTRTPIFAVNTTRNPAVQFSNNPATGFRSSLSGPPIADLQTFEGTGVRTAVQVTAGYYFHLGRAGAGAAARQAPSGAMPTRATQGKWEVEGHGGWFGASDVTGGTPIDSFPVGEPVATSQANSRAVSSWMFGDGPVLISQAFTQFVAFTARITPLDGLLQAPFASRKGGGSIGFRVGRQLTSRFGAEFNYDRVQASLEMRDGASTAIEQTRTSFLAVFTSLFPGGAGSTLTLAPARDIRQDFVTGTVNVNLGAYGAARPYVTAGLGAVFNHGEAPSASLDGSYIFPSTGTSPVLIDERDRVVVRAVVKDTSLVSVVGGGVRLHVSPRQGVRVDVRVHLTDNPIDTAVDATPGGMTLPTGGAALVFPTNPSLQFSSTSARRSSLSGPAVNGLTTFSGEGLQTHVNFSIGYFFRF